MNVIQKMVICMKYDLDYYMNLSYKLDITPDLEEGGYAAQYPELPGCITCADTLEELLMLAEDAKKSWLTVALGSGDEIPLPAAPV